MNTPSYLRNRKLIWLLCTILIVVVVVSSCGQAPSVTPVTEEPPTEQPTTEVTEEPTGEPTEGPARTKCDGADGTYICKGDREITLEGVPSGVTPYVLTIEPAFREFLLSEQAKKEGTTCIFMVAADLAFYGEDDKLINGFDHEITLTYSYLPQDDDAYKSCQQEAATAANISTEQVEYVPVYYHQEFWRPFKNFELDKATGIMKITFKSWGDQPIGGGSQP